MMLFFFFFSFFLVGEGERVWDKVKLHFCAVNVLHMPEVLISSWRSPTEYSSGLCALV